jgi:oligopeptide transport system substrate-binding protein
VSAKPSFLYQLLSTTLLTAFLTACGGGETNVEKGNRANMLYYGLGAEPQDIDPQVTTGVPSSKVEGALFESLINNNPGDLAPIPGTAKSWTISADGTIYTFTIRPSARWSNGDPVTAEDFRWSWQRALTPTLGNPYGYMYNPIKNAKEYRHGEVVDFAQVGIKVIAPLTLQVELSVATSYFLGLLTHPVFYPVHRASLEAVGNPYQIGQPWTRPGRLIGNGAFKLTEWKLFKDITVEKNPHYWAADSVRLSAIKFVITENISTEERMYRADQLHVTNDTPIDKMPRYREEKPSEFFNNPYLGTYFYRFNVTKPPFDNLMVRRALAMTVNRDHVVKHVAKGGQIPAYTITPPNTNGYFAESDLTFEPEKARQLLAEAGYPNGEGFPVTELLYNTSESHRKLAVALQQMWKTELNIDITLRNEDWKVYLESQKQGDYEISRGSWVGDYLDPNNFLDLWVTEGGNNRTGWSNAEFDKLVLELAPSASDQTARYDLLRQAEKILTDDLPILPVYTYTTKFLVKPCVKGLQPNILNKPIFRYVYLDPNACKAN